MSKYLPKCDQEIIRLLEGVNFDWWEKYIPPINSITKRPTIALVIEWLYQVHNIHIGIYWASGKFKWQAEVYDIISSNTLYEEIDQKESKDEVTKEAIKIALEFIKNTQDE